MDIDAILARKPLVAVVDELAHTNIPGSKHRKRYEVSNFTDAKIDVLSAVNIQHVESLAPTPARSPASRPFAKTSDWFYRYKTVMVDLTPRRSETNAARVTGRKSGAGAHDFFRREKSNRPARTMRQVANRWIPQPGIVHGSEGNSGHLAGARTHRCVHRHQRAGAVLDCPRGADGATHGRGSYTRCTWMWSGQKTARESRKHWKPTWNLRKASARVVRLKVKQHRAAKYRGIHPRKHQPVILQAAHCGRRMQRELLAPDV